MAAEVKYFCDGCGAMKGQANKWWVLLAGPTACGISPFSEGRAHHETAMLACSSACLIKAIDTWCHQVTGANHA